ncbi:MAG TPA: LruC domain-containing protein [Bacteroidales bacterium]|nr:LruC domain-containing protein [Bacteroidales bacterium]
MKRYLYLPAILGLLALLVSCRKQPSGQENEKKFEGLVVPASFNWSTTKTIQLNILSEAAAVINISSADGAVLYHKGYYNHLSDSYQTSVTVPAFLNELAVNGKTIALNSNSIEVDLNATYVIKGKAAPFQIPDGLVSWWKFDEGNGTTVADVNNLNNGSIQNGAAFQTGISGSALYFDGVDDNVSIPNSSTLNLTGNEMSLSLWFSRDPSFKGGTFIAQRMKYILRINDGGRITIGLYNPTWHEATTAWADRVIDTDWHHLVATYDGNQLKVMIDGVEKAVTETSGNINNSTSEIQIGNLYSQGYFPGLIDEVMIFGKSLSLTEIENIRNQTLNPSNGEDFLISHWKLDEATGTAISDSKGSNHGTASNMGWTSGMSGAAVVCNGTDCNINIPNHTSLNPTEALSMMAWVKTFENKTTKVAQKGDWDGHGLGQGKWDGWNVHVRTADNVSHTLHWGDGLPQFDTWYHLAMTYDGAALKIFINGQLKNTAAVSGALKVNGRAFSIGSDNAAQKFFNGQIDDVRYYGKALSPIEIQTLFGGSGPVSDSDGDGIADAEEDYPDDPSRAFNNFYPAAGSGSLAFEDLWPGKGDYDFNDLVSDYRFTIVTNANNKLTELTGTFVIRANGAGLENGFGFQLDNAINLSDVEVSGSHLSSDYIGLAENGLENGQEKITAIVFDNIKDVLQSPSGFGANVIPEDPYIAPDTIQIVMAFKPNTYSIEDLRIEHFNPFLIVNKVRGHEIHLPDYAPTSLADPGIFGSSDDDSDATAGRYYKTSQNLPWAIHIASSFDYTIESAQIIHGHLHFAEWAESGGSSFSDWYLEKAAYRDASKIYSKP